MTNFHQNNTNREFILAKFQPSNILLINRYTKQAYNYYELNKAQSISQQLTHPYLLRPLIYGTGLLYPKGESNMKIQLENRKRAYNTQYFSDEDLTNTFVPLFQCIDYLHKNNIIHAQISSQTIVLINGQIKLRDWLVKTQLNSYYPKKKKENLDFHDDLVALGQVFMQFSTLRKSSGIFEEKDLDLAFESIVEQYDKTIIFALLILMKRKIQFFSQVIPLLKKNSDALLSNTELNFLYNQIKSEKSRKSIKPQITEKNFNVNLTSLNTPTPKKIQISVSPFLQSSPNKKFNITQASTVKKAVTSRLDQNQNSKKVFNEQVKKRQIQKITKIIQRSNAFVNELMARKNNSEHVSGQVLKKINGKNNININHLAMTGTNLTNMSANISMYTVQPKKIKQTSQGPIVFSPNKRLRTMSKKK